MHQITGSYIVPDPRKIETVRDWPPPSSITEIRRFLVFVNYFRRFIDHFSSLSSSLEEITGKTAHFIWNSERQRAFDSLKNALLCTPVLRLANVDKAFRVETDASDFAVAAVLSQEVDAGSWLPVAYASGKLSSAERNYMAAERETVAIVFALKSCICSSTLTCTLIIWALCTFKLSTS